MKGYIEEGAWVSCSFDLDGDPQQIEKVEDRPDFYSGYANKETNHLVRKKDTLIVNQFKCKLTAKMWGGLAALVTGFVAGLAIAVCVVSGPIGWMLLGAVAGAAIVGAGVGYAAAACMHDCNTSLKSITWKNLHTRVKIKGENPALYNYSLIECSNHGILVASETFEEAKKISDEMKWNTRIELGVQVLSQAIMGVASGYMFGKNIKSAGGFKAAFFTKEGLQSGDLLQPIVMGAEYIYSDMVRPEMTAEEGAMWSAGFTISPFFISPLAKVVKNPWGKALFRGLGSELKGGDIGLAALNFIIDNGANFIEQNLSRDNAWYDENKGIQEGIIFQNFDNDKTQKTIVADTK